jgi:hypothetical protein
MSLRALASFLILLYLFYLFTRAILGSFVDERGIQRPQAILPHRINGQYILEVCSF